MRFFETAGYAIVIAYDDKPILTTDPWINEDAYLAAGRTTTRFHLLRWRRSGMRNTTGFPTATQTI